MPENQQNRRIGAAYIRVSTDEQLDYSPESQLDAIESYAVQNHILILKEFIYIEKEGISGKQAQKRPQFQRMMAMAKSKPKPFDVILVWKFSRFARNQDESSFYKGMLRKKLKIDVISVSEPIMDGMYGRLIEMIIEWQDEFYSYNLSTEVIRGMKKKAEKGFYNGSVPYGYRKEKDKMPVIDPMEAPIVQHIFALYTSGYDKNYVVRCLNERGIRTKHGHAFNSACVSYMLDNPFYIGKVRWNRRSSSASNALKEESEWILSDGHHEAIIDSDTWQKAQEKTRKLLLVREKYAHPISHQKHWLSGIVKCSVCGKSLSWKCGYKNTSPSFQCLGYRKGLHTESQSISEKKLTAAVIESLKNAVGEQTEVFELTKRNACIKISETAYCSQELKKIALQEKRSREAYLNGIDTIVEYKAAKAMLLARRQALLPKAENTPLSVPDQSDAAYAVCDKFLNVVFIIESTCPYEIKAEALRSILRNAVYNKEEQKIVFDYYLA